MFGELNENEIEQLMKRQLVGRLGCSADGLTYVVPLSYAYDQTGIYVHSREGLKIDLIKKNPSVCFQVDDTKDLANWQSAICWGTFEKVTDEAELTQAIKLLRSRVLPAISSETMRLKNDDWPFGSGIRDSDDGAIFRIRVTKKTGRFEKNPGGEYFAS